MRIEDPSGTFTAIISKRTVEENVQAVQPGGVLLLRRVSFSLCICVQRAPVIISKTVPNHNRNTLTTVLYEQVAVVCPRVGRVVVCRTRFTQLHCSNEN